MWYVLIALATVLFMFPKYSLVILFFLLIFAPFLLLLWIIVLYIKALIGK